MYLFDWNDRSGSVTLSPCELSPLFTLSLSCPVKGEGDDIEWLSDLTWAIVFLDGWGKTHPPFLPDFFSQPEPSCPSFSLAYFVTGGWVIEHWFRHWRRWLMFLCVPDREEKGRQNGPLDMKGTEERVAEWGHNLNTGCRERGTAGKPEVEGRAEVHLRSPSLSLSLSLSGACVHWSHFAFSFSLTRCALCLSVESESCYCYCTVHSWPLL